MSDDSVTERDAIAGQDWDIPVTDEFVDRVRRGVRRRRMWRRASTGGAALAVAGTAVTVSLLAGGGPAPVVPAAPSPSASAVAPSARILDGFTIGYVPDGAAPVHPDSIYTSAVGPDGPGDGDAPAPGQPGVAVAVRRFDRAVGEGLFVSVLRPSVGPGSTTSVEQVGDWVHGWATAGREPVRSFATPVGPARLLANRGNEVTTYEVVVRARGGVVVTVSGAAGYSAEELERVARGVTG